MTYYVYKARRGRGLSYPNNWELDSRHEALADAESVARKLCSPGTGIYTEPGRGLKRGFFGRVTSKSWSAMIETKDIHNKESSNG